METELQPRQENPSPAVDKPIVKEDGVYCPMCCLPTGRRIRGKIYCGNCGFIES